MIKVTGSIKRAFIFPADANTAVTYYSELTRIAQFMPHISLVEAYTEQQIRVLYKTLELGAYTIRIFCDIQNEVDQENLILHIKPLDINDPVEANASVSTTTGQGIYSLQAQFFDVDSSQCRVEYKIFLEGELRRPLGMRLMPRRVVNRIAQNITNSRMREIADGFIEASVDAFSEWQAENQTTA
ncbi:MAG: hypothetical protein GY943_00500 [Chloroflexi bacterium]|nr:hypothetical protein [Chloroflexota bacterium]